MPTEQHAPRNFQGVMVSSTFKDLEHHREVLITAIQREAFAAVVMENDTAKISVDLIESSLQMVRDASAYVGVIGMKYGQTPIDPNRNPHMLSITELEFDEAMHLKRPILLFLMDDEHPLPKSSFENDPDKQRNLTAFRERAKLIGPDSKVSRIYATFNSLEEFKDKAPRAIAGMRRDMEAVPAGNAPVVITDQTPPNTDNIPTPPAFYAEPRYGASSSKFFGRDSELTILNDWAAPADPHPILLFDAIGGNGKSMLTWEWTTNRQPRTDWAGRFWFSFYEGGAIMASFCRHALAYITCQPVESFKEVKTPELSRQLLYHLQARSWLLVLDGLERVLVAYNRNDAPSLSDEEANYPTDQVTNRDPRSAIRVEDDDLLRALATVAPSKILISSRLTPAVLLNPAGQGIAGVRRMPLTGLRPPDAEQLLRSNGVTGDSKAIQNYLQTNCDCHPLTTGVLAGLIQNYLPDRGNFDSWAADLDYGGRLNLADLDLVQRRNHILKTAIDGLSSKSRQLLSTLALLHGAVEYPTLIAFNPHLPSEPRKVEELHEPENWPWITEEEKVAERHEYETVHKLRKDYEHALDAWRHSPEYRAARLELDKTVLDFQNRGLLQYDAQGKRYDLHPVVRGVASGRLNSQETTAYGQRIVDHFAAKTHNPWEQAQTLEDVSAGIHVVRTLLKMCQLQRAADAYIGDLAGALLYRLEAHSETLSLLQPFFPNGWSIRPSGIEANSQSRLVNYIAAALHGLGEFQEALNISTLLIECDLGRSRWGDVTTEIANVATDLGGQNRLAAENRISRWAFKLAEALEDNQRLFSAQLVQFTLNARSGNWTLAQAEWNDLYPTIRTLPRAWYNLGEAEYFYAEFRFWRGDLQEEQLSEAEGLAHDRLTARNLHLLRGEWRLQQREWLLAVQSLENAANMARAIGFTDGKAETQLAIARFHVGQLSDPRREAERLSDVELISDSPLAELWLAIGDRDKAKHHALEAYKWAWADGEPFVFRYELDKARALLEQLNAEIPQFPPYDPSKEEKFPWEDKLASAIEKIRAEKAAAKAAESPEDNFES